MLHINKIQLDSFYTITAFPQHAEMKSRLLDLIEQYEAPCESNAGEYYTDIISKYDFDNCTDWNRQWVREFGPVAQEFSNTICESLGYQYCSIVSMWFQQYASGDTHGWHIHDSNFSCVYFLELPENSSATELINPFNQSDLITPAVKEGDVVMFPSFVMHRSPLLKQGRKTSIAFNINAELIRQDIINNLRKYND
jgi:hypothetical protein